MKLAAATVAAILALVAPATAAEVPVTGDEETGLGAAIVAAEPGDTVVIPTGDYLLTEGDEADMVTGSRFLGDPGYKVPLGRRAGNLIFAVVMSAITRRKVTDPTSGFRMTNRRGIELFARDYPHDYPEVEAILMMHAHRLRLHEVHVSMNARGYGRSSIDYPRSAYYMVKVLLAIFIGLFRRRPTAIEASGKDEILGGPPMDTGELKAITGGDK